ncbi:MAG: hypothetical protein ACXQT6_00295 [Candidatus Methanospirareceae archaeon]
MKSSDWRCGDAAEEDTSGAQEEVRWMKKISYEQFERLINEHSSYFDFCEKNIDYYQRVLHVDRSVFIEDEETDDVYEFVFSSEAEAESFYKNLKYLSDVLENDKTLDADTLELLYKNADIAEDAIYLLKLYVDELKKRCNAENLVDLHHHIDEHGLDSDTLNYAEETAIQRARQNPAFFDHDSVYELFDELKHLIF